MDLEIIYEAQGTEAQGTGHRTPGTEQMAQGSYAYSDALIYRHCGFFFCIYLQDSCKVSFGQYWGGALHATVR